jgi:uncharacterized protein
MNPQAILNEVNHRPWPLPGAPWIMVQIWHDLLFAHWPISPDVMKQHVPPKLSLDTFDGVCWIGIVPFHMSNVRLRGVPPIPGFATFAELNVRTYVTVDGKPRVYFFSLDAANLTAVWAARRFYHLPYFYADMKVRVAGHSVRYWARRKEGDAKLSGSYRPIAPVQLCQRNTLEHWLTERYCLYTVREGCVYRCEVHHRPWPLQDAEAHFQTNTMAGAAGIAIPNTEAVLHFSRRQEVMIWPLTRTS